MRTTGTTDGIERLATRDLLFELGGRLSGIDHQLSYIRDTPMSARIVAAMEGAKRELRRAHVAFDILHRRLLDETVDGRAMGDEAVQPRTVMEFRLRDIPRGKQPPPALATPGLDYFARDLRAIARAQSGAAGCPHNGMQVALWREGEDIFRSAAAPDPSVLDFLCGPAIARRVRDVRCRLRLLPLRQFWRAF